MALPARDKHDDLTPEEIAAPVALEQRNNVHSVHWA